MHNLPGPQTSTPFPSFVAGAPVLGGGGGPGNFDPELFALQARRAQLLRKKIELIRYNGLAYYKPSAKQDAFHRAGTFKKRMVRAGNRFGKSTMGCAEDCAWARGERPWYGESDPARYAGIPRHPTKGLIITTDWDKVDEIWTSERGDNPGKIWHFLPKDAVVSKRRNHSGAIDAIEVRSALYEGTSLIRFDTVKSWKANPMGSESSDWDWVHVDEPCPEKMFKAVARGLIDRNGSAWFTLTPLNEFWINDLFFPQETGGQPRLGVWFISATIYENPYLTAAAIAEFESLLTEEEKECRLRGIPLHLAGLIYKNFNWDKHVLKEVPIGWDNWLTPPKNWPLYVHIDPHPQTPHAVLFCAVSPFGQRFYYRDIFRKCGVAALTRDILDATSKNRLVSAHADPLAFIEHPLPNAKTGAEYTSMAMEFADNGLYVAKATKALEQGILRVNEELKKDTLYGPALVFSPHAARTLWEIQRYAWDDKENRPRDVDDHMMENLYRQELSDPKWVNFEDVGEPIEDMDITGPRWEEDETVSYGGM